MFFLKGNVCELDDMEHIKNILYVREAVEQETVLRIINKGNNDPCWSN
jgi:hypothetical protein